MSDPAHVLVVAHQTAATSGLLDTVRARARRSTATFHLVVPRQPHGMHKVVDPQDTGEDDEHAHEDDQVGVEALGPEYGAQGRVRRRVIDGIDERASAEDDETRSHRRHSTAAFVVSQVLC